MTRNHIIEILRDKYNNRIPTQVFLDAINILEGMGYKVTGMMASKYSISAEYVTVPPKSISLYKLFPITERVDQVMCVHTAASGRYTVEKAIKVLTDSNNRFITLVLINR